MSLSLIGLGLGDARDITVRGLELVKKADKVYLEMYTAILCAADPTDCGDLSNLCEVLGRDDILVADRDAVESGEVIEGCTDVEDPSKRLHVALLVVGDPFSATTHTDLVARCKAENVTVHVAGNASILTAVGATGLQLYRFGQTLSLCFWLGSWRPTSWFPRLVENRKLGLHTLCLLDIKVKEISDENLARGRQVYEPPRFMTVAQGVEQLLEIEADQQTGAITPETVCCGVARLGMGHDKEKIAFAPLKELLDVDFGGPLHSLIVCGDIHECETDLIMYYLAPGCSLATMDPAEAKQRLLNNKELVAPAASSSSPSA